MSHAARLLARTTLMKPVVFALCLLPLAALVYGAVTDGLGANPAEALVRGTGDWTLRFLCLGLALTPLRVTARLPALGHYRRMLGLFAFAYAALHLVCYALFDQGFVIADIARDIAKRPFILVGFLAFVTLLPLAATSNRHALRALGARRWQSLHRAVYAIVLLGLLHLLWLRSGKQHYEDVVLYAAVVLPLLGWRLWRRIGRPNLLRTAADTRGVGYGRENRPIQ